MTATDPRNLPPLDFWHEGLGKHLSDAPASGSTKAPVLTRMKKGVGLNPLGAGLEAAYIVTPEHAWLIGRYQGDNTDRITFIATDADNAPTSRRYIARWLVDHAQAPFMIGVIGNANPNESFRLSNHPAACYFCEAGGGFGFNLNEVRKAREIIGDNPWKMVAAGIHQHHSYQQAQTRQDHVVTTRERDKLVKMLDKHPDLRGILQNTNIRPNSGEYRILSWLMYEA